MSDPNEPTPAEPAEQSRTSRRPMSLWVLAAPAIALLLGLVLGGLVVGVATDDSDAGPVDDNNPSPTPSTSAPGTAVVVPDACLESAQTVAEATSLIRNGVGAIREFRAEEILDLLNRLEDLDAQAREQASLCADVEISDAPLPSSPSSAPSSPTAS